MKVNLIKTAFTGGMIDPLIFGRMDLPRYQQGALTIKNAIVMPSGGCTRIPGTRFVRSEGNVIDRKIPFHILKTDETPAVLQGYVVSLRSDDKIRFYTNNALIFDSGVPYEIDSPFISADLWDIKYEVFDNVVYFVHPDFPVKKLTRTNDTSWAITDVTFKYGAEYSVTTLTRTGSTVEIIVENFRLPVGLSVGKYVLVSGATQTEYNGLFQITATSDVAGNPPSPDYFKIHYTVTGTPATPGTGTIKIQATLFNSTFGYPSSITFFNQRMILGNTKTKRQSIFGSEAGDIVDFEFGTNDADAFNFMLVDASTPINHLLKLRKMIVALTSDGELTIEGSGGKTLTPTSVDVDLRDNKGSNNKVKPVRVGDEIIYINEYGTKMLTFTYVFESDTYRGANNSLIAASLLSDGIKELAYTKEPFPVIWMITNAGKLVMVTYSKENEVIAFSYKETDGKFLTMAPVQAANGQQMWFTVERTIYGQTVNYTEYMNITLQTYENTDCAFMTTWIEETIIYGLDHLEGKTVDILADDIPLAQQVVTDGLITLPRYASKVEIGLNYETEIEDLPVEIQTMTGTTQSQKVSIHEIWVLLDKSIGCEVNGEVVPFRTFGERVLDQPVPLFSGWKKARHLGWENTGVKIKQTQPLPFTVLAIAKKVTIND